MPEPHAQSTILVSADNPYATLSESRESFGPGEHQASVENGSRGRWVLIWRPVQFQLLAAQKPGLTVEGMGPVLGWDMPPERPESLASRWVEEMDRHGVASAAIIASLPGDEPSVAAAVKAFPGRFQGYFLFNPD